MTDLILVSVARFTNTIEGWEWYFHPTLHDGYDNLHLLGLKFNHVDESIP